MGLMDGLLPGRLLLPGPSRRSTALSISGSVEAYHQASDFHSIAKKDAAMNFSNHQAQRVWTLTQYLFVTISYHRGVQSVEKVGYDPTSTCLAMGSAFSTKKR